ncbi:hypothetical protein C8R45DRAFT_935451 [Mycena sanguinolenta]|nr:hypothetical protein C8R45DRAFT_935451 [Mycena sanguinolenta]
MPGAAQVMENIEVTRDSDAPPPCPEKVKLWMPIDMPLADENDILHGCVPGLMDMDTNENVSSQVQATKAQTLIRQRYRRGHTALVRLKGEDVFPHLQELKPEHIVLDGDYSKSGAASQTKLDMLEHVVLVDDGHNTNAWRRNQNVPGTSKRVISWIWTAPGALENEEERLHNSICMEWARAHAGKSRWSEEVVLMREMRHVLRYLAGQVAWWQEHVEVEQHNWLAAVYALKQATWHECLAVHFRLKWNTPALTTAQELVAAEGWTELFE